MPLSLLLHEKILLLTCNWLRSYVSVVVQRYQYGCSSIIESAMELSAS